MKTPPRDEVYRGLVGGVLLMTRNMFTWCLSLVVASGVGCCAAAAADGKKLFEENCSGCHSLSEQQIVGPGLKDVVKRRGREWLLHFVREPGEVRRMKDPIAMELKKKFGASEMPDLGLSRDDVGAIVDFLDNGGGASAAPAVAALPPGDAGRGRDLFMGMAKLKNGGPACISCHPYGGGSLGPDLTNVAAKMGSPGVAAALKGISFPTMKPVYRDHPLADEEVSDLTSYFEQISKAADTPIMPVRRFMVWAAGLCIALLVILNLIWARRLRGVRRGIVDKGGA